MVACLCIVCGQTVGVKNLLVVGGAFDFRADFPEYNVIARSLDGTRWLLREDNTLFLFDSNGAMRIDAVLWRVGAIRPRPQHRQALELIRLAGVPCINAAQTLLRGFDRLSMLAELREVGVPFVPFTAALGESVLERIEPDLPCVLKLGNWHGGLGKARLTTPETWADARDLALTSEDYATVEPFINYKRDVRVMVVGAQMWAMSRSSEAWKVNRGVSEIEIIPVPAELGDWTRRVQSHLAADMLGLDWIETPAGKWICLECNDVPGLTGWPDGVRRALISCVREKIQTDL